MLYWFSMVRITSQQLQQIFGTALNVSPLHLKAPRDRETTATLLFDLFVVAFFGLSVASGAIMLFGPNASAPKSPMPPADRRVLVVRLEKLTIGGEAKGYVTNAS